jgi:hypothetical protein
MAVSAHLRAAHADKGRILIRLVWMRGAGEHRRARHQPGGHHSAVEIVDLMAGQWRAGHLHDRLAMQVIQKPWPSAWKWTSGEAPDQRLPPGSLHRCLIYRWRYAS